MKAVGRILLGLPLIVAAAFGQGAPAPFVLQQYFSNSGQPLALGSLCTYLSGTSTPSATFSNSTLTTANQQCLPLNSSGRPTSNGIWINPAIVYRFVLKDSGGSTIWTQDGVNAAAGGSGILWSETGVTINNTPGTKVCISATTCISALALLNVAGTSTGNTHLVRIDDTAGNPGIDLYASGTSVGSFTGDVNGLRLRSPSGASQLTAAAGSVTVENTASSGSTTFTIAAGGTQGSANLFQIQTPSGTNVSWADNQGRFVSPLFNATASTSTTLGFQLSNGLFQVFGDGRVNADIFNFLTGIELNGAPLVDAAGNATVRSLTCTATPCGSGGGGGGGTPGGSTTQVQYNNAGAFAGSANFIWNNASQLLTVTASGAGAAGIAVATGYMQADKGFLATPGTATNYNSIQAPGGGMAALSFKATNYINTGKSAGAPAATAGDVFDASDPGALYWDTGTAGLKVWDGATWVAIATGGATPPGGATTNVQYNSAGSFAGSANFIWNNAGRVLTVTTASSASAGVAVANGFVQADAGFYATVGTATNYNSIQAPGGGMAGKSFTASKYIQMGSGAAAPAATTGDTFNPGAMYWNTSTSLAMIYNGSAWVPLVSGGSGGTPAGSNNNVQFNNVGVFGGSANFGWDNAQHLLTITGVGLGNPGLAVGTGFIQADGGFYATASTAVNYNSIQAPNGGVYGKSLGAINYTQVGSSSGTPSLTFGDSFRPGALFYNTALGALQVYNGGFWATLASGGGVSAIIGTANQVLANGFSGGAGSTGNVTLTLPQSIGTTSTPTFGAVVANGAFNSTVASGAIAFQTNNANFQVDGLGNVSAATQFNTPGVYKQGGSVVINASRQFVGAGVDVGGSGINAAGYNVNGGFVGQAYTVSIPGMSIAGVPSCTNGLIFRGGVLVSCF